MLGIKQKMGELRALHGKATLSRFDDTNDDEVQVGGAMARPGQVGRAKRCAGGPSLEAGQPEPRPCLRSLPDSVCWACCALHHPMQVEVLTQQITRMFRKCEARLQQFGTEPSASEADDKVKRNVQVGARAPWARTRACGAAIRRGAAGGRRTCMHAVLGVHRAALFGC